MCVLCISDYVIVILYFILFSTSMKMSIESMKLDMVLETHPTSPHVDSTAFKSQPVTPSAPGQDSRGPDNIVRTAEVQTT